MQNTDDLITEAESGNARALAALASIPVDAEVLRRFASSSLRELQVRAIASEDTPPDALAVLAALKDLGLRASMLDRATLPEPILVSLAESAHLLARVLARPDCPVSLLVEAAASHDPDLQLLAAQHAKTPVESIDDLARDASDSRVEAALWRWAENDPERLDAFADAVSATIRTQVARHPETDGDLLRHLARDTDEDVRAAVAARPDLSDAMAMALAADPSPEVARAAAGHPVVRRQAQRRTLLVGGLLAVVVLGVLAIVVLVGVGWGVSSML